MCVLAQVEAQYSDLDSSVLDHVSKQPYLSKVKTLKVHNNHKFLNFQHKNNSISFFTFSILKNTMLLRGITSTPLPYLRINPLRNATVSSQLTISDASLESRGFVLRRTISDLNLDHLNTIFVAVGFPRRDPQKIKLALQHTHSVLWVEYKKTQKPVAFARATGDGVFNAIIWDVVVDPSFQGIGLGKAVMERLIEELLGKGIVNIALYSEPRVLGFYRPLGFVADPDGIKGMVYSTKKKNKK